jgi:hypothetical protein
MAPFEAPFQHLAERGQKHLAGYSTSELRFETGTSGIRSGSGNHTAAMPDNRDERCQALPAPSIPAYAFVP